MSKGHSNWYFMVSGYCMLLDGVGRLVSFGHWKPDNAFQFCLRTAHEEYEATVQPGQSDE